MMLAKGNTFDLMRIAKRWWPHFRDRPVDAETAQRITDHFLELLRGTSVFAYSSPYAETASGIRERFGIDATQRILCATLSSPDERFAAETVGACAPAPDLLFQQQADWIGKLIEHMRSHPGRFLIVRVHPREFPNKREGVKSAHAHQLEAKLSDLPPNVAVNWPTDGISLYDLAQITDVFLSSWSSVGKEMSLLGIPVVLYSSDLPLYPAEINYVGTTCKEYFSQIDKALADGWRYETVRQTYRWYQVEYNHMLIDISDVHQEFTPRTRSLVMRIKSKICRTLNPYGKQLRDCRARPKVLRAQREIATIFERSLDSPLDLQLNVEHPSEQEELVILRAQLARLLVALRPTPGQNESQLTRRIDAFLSARPIA